MIFIEYTNDIVEGEPGPNLYWKGKPNDYLCLINDLHSLGNKNDETISIDSFSYIKIEDPNLKILAKSTNDEKKLIQIINSTIQIDLDKTLWRQVFVKFLMISYTKSHDFVEFDSINLHEDANFIISSEF